MRPPCSCTIFRVVSSPSPEDQFAAQQLSSGLSSGTRTAIPLAVADSTGEVIKLTRTGAVDALPGTDEHAGPDSREAYEIHIDPHGAEIRARSSAGPRRPPADRPPG
jgi:hypothetical protein